MKRRQVMTANVVLPSDVARDKYVDHCFRTHTVSVITGEGDFISECPVAYNFCGINEGFFYSLDIPEKAGDIGTRVLLLYLQERDLAIVIGCLQDGKQVKLDEEFQMKMMRRTEGNSFMIRGSGLKGVLDLISQGSGDKSGQINLKATNDTKTGMINFVTDSLVTKVKETLSFTTNKLFELYIKNKVEQDEFTRLTWELGVGFTLSDEFGNGLTINENGWSFSGINGETFKMTNGNLELNGNTYSVPLGEKLNIEATKEKTVMTALLAALSAYVVDGGVLAAAVNTATAALPRGSFDSGVLSSKNKLD